MRIPEGRFWKAGKRHKVRTLELVELGLPDAGVFVAKVLSGCGETIFPARLTHEEDAPLCRRRGCSG